MASFGFVVHQGRPLAAELVRDVVGWLADRGHEVRVLGDDASATGLDELGVAAGEFPLGLDLTVSVGGDGTMLRAVDLVAAHGVPLVGVNVGHLGYLTELEPRDLRMALKRFLAGSHGVEERMMLDVDVESAETPARTGGPASGRATLDPAAHVPSSGPFRALNEVVVEKTPMGHTVRLGVVLDGRFFTTYAADGLIVASPTGSTAYSFSARGPIVAPRHRALVLTPVSPHMLFDRSMVLEPTTTLRLEVVGDRPATVSLDGRNLGWLREGDAIVCTASSVVARLLTFGPRDFHEILKAKFGLADR